MEKIANTFLDIICWSPALTIIVMVCTAFFWAYLEHRARKPKKWLVYIHVSTYETILQEVVSARRPSIKDQNVIRVERLAN